MRLGTVRCGWCGTRKPLAQIPATYCFLAIIAAFAAMFYQMKDLDLTPHIAATDSQKAPKIQVQTTAPTFAFKTGQLELFVPKVVVDRSRR
jgi:hypothetical protein